MKSLIGIYKQNSKHIKMYEISPLYNTEICIYEISQIMESKKEAK